MTSPRRIGLLGGTFDPIHCGHLDLGHAAMRVLALERVAVIPSHIPPHRPQPVATSYHRFAMAALAVGDNVGWRALDIELRMGNASYTSATLDKFHERGYAPAELFFVVGADAFIQIATWKDYPNVLAKAHYAVVSRPGFPVADLPQELPSLKSRMSPPPFYALAQPEPSIFLIDARTADVSASAIRERCAAGQPIAGLVPRGVQQHIEQHGLYTSTTPGRRASDALPRPPAGRLHGED